MHERIIFNFQMSYKAYEIMNQIEGAWGHPQSNLFKRELNTFQTWLLIEKNDDWNCDGFFAIVFPWKAKHISESFPDVFYEICQNTEDVMGIFSEALTELDRNTVDYMIDQLKKSNEQLQGENEQLQGENEQLRSEKELIQQQAKNDKELLQDEIARLQAELDKVRMQHE